VAILVVKLEKKPGAAGEESPGAEVAVDGGMGAAVGVTIGIDMTLFF